MLKRTFTTIFALVCLSLVLSLAQDKNPERTPPLLTFSDLNRSDLDEAPFRIEGSVTQIYKCPPCPAGAQCKPCLGNHIVITDNLDEKNPALIKRLRIFNDKPEQFEEQKKYSFVVKLRGKSKARRAVEEVELISSSPLEAKPNP